MKKPNQQTGFMKIDGNNSQYGGTILGFVLGLGAGLGIAFVIAFYLSKNTVVGLYLSLNLFFVFCFQIQNF